MRERNQNSATISGYVFSHDLEIRQVQNEKSKNYGKNYIGGNLHIAVDEEEMNVIPVHYSFVTEFTKAGTPNRTYTILKEIIETNATCQKVGKSEAMIVRATPSLDLNEFYSTRTGDIVSAKRLEGGFISFINEYDLPSNPLKRNEFTVDMYIDKTRYVESEKSSDYLEISGLIFNFRNDGLPFTFTVRDQSGIEYFENAEKPMFTKISGNINNQSFTIERVIESAWGDSKVEKYERNFRDWTVTWSQSEPYEYGEGGVLTKEDITKVMQDRELKLAGLRGEGTFATTKAPIQEAPKLQTADDVDLATFSSIF